jgi:hypothetical protein
MTGPMTSEFTEAEAPPIQLPPPQCPAVEVTDEEMPGGVRAVVKDARANGFTVKVTYSRGPWQHATQESYVIKEMIRVVGRHDDGRFFYGTWLSPVWAPGQPLKGQKWGFNTAHIAGLLGMRSSTLMRDYIKGKKVE